MRLSLIAFYSKMCTVRLLGILACHVLHIEISQHIQAKGVPHRPRPSFRRLQQCSLLVPRHSTVAARTSRRMTIPHRRRKEGRGPALYAPHDFRPE